MSTHGVQADELFVVSNQKRCAVTVQVNEVSLETPLGELEDADLGGIVECLKGHESSGKTLVVELSPKCVEALEADCNETMLQKNTVQFNEGKQSYASVSDDDGEAQGRTSPKKPIMRLPPFSDLGFSTPVLSSQMHPGSTDAQDPLSSTAQASLQSASGSSLEHIVPSFWPLQSHTTSSAVAPRCDIMALLTPPEDRDCFEWKSIAASETKHTTHATSSGGENPHGGSFERQSGQSATSRPTGISLPAFVDMSSQGGGPSTWLERATNIIVTNLCNNTNSTQVQMVVQALPSQSKNPNTKPIFQEIVENIQQQAREVPYITITHAVSQVISMEEVPASPPATPNTTHHSDDYFDNQTIFTHAAVIPTYHNTSSHLASLHPRPSSIIAAPSSINVSTLERYIPPTSAQEVRDFFSISRRSYLVDRLTELSAANGTLLLVYPTQKGGKTFAKHYIGRVIDPFLRQFILLNDLTTDAAAALGQLSSVSSMIDFEQIKAQLSELCSGLTQRAPSRGLRSAYTIIHAEATEVVIDRPTWLEWFLEQEQGRLRQNLVDYQKGGGRMPARGFDASPGLLARAVVDGIRMSREAAGGEGIEVGVFVIRRSIV